MEDLIAQTQARRAQQHEQTMSHASDIQGLQKHEELKRTFSDHIGKLSHTITGHQPSVTVLNPITSVKTPDVAKVVSAVKSLETALKPLENDYTPLIEAINGLIPELKAIPTSVHVPEQRESVSVSNLSDITDAVATLKGAIDKLGKQFSPNIEVKAAEVKVDAPDLSPIEAGLADIRAAVDAIKLPEAKPIDLSPVIQASEATTGAINGLRFPTASITPTDPLVRYSPSDIDDAGTTQYFGYTDMLGHWYIQRMDNAASPKTLRYATGSGNYATGWTARASQTYDYFHVTFGR